MKTQIINDFFGLSKTKNIDMPPHGASLLRGLKHHENVPYPISPSEGKEQVKDRREAVSKGMPDNKFMTQE